MKVSMGVALPLFVESSCELVDIELSDYIEEAKLKEILQKVLPKEAEIMNVKKLDKGAKAIDITVSWAEYEIKPMDENLYKFEEFKYNVEKVLSSDEILLEKKNKKGLIKTTNVKKSILDYRFAENRLFIRLKSGQGSEIPPLRADDLMKLVSKDNFFDIKRVKFFDESLREL